jgi:hypothetical protein
MSSLGTQIFAGCPVAALFPIRTTKKLTKKLLKKLMKRRLKKRKSRILKRANLVNAAQLWWRK